MTNKPDNFEEYLLRLQSMGMSTASEVWADRVYVAYELQNTKNKKVKCEYCGRTNEKREYCAGCGAPCE